jgi:hypothetical protein
MRCALASVLLLSAAAAGRPPPRGVRPRPPTAEPQPTHRVVGGVAELVPRLGANAMAELAPGTLVRLLRPEGPDRARVETLGSVRLQGIVRRAALGLRVVTATELRPRGGGRPVRLLPGADVRLLGAAGPDVLVETVGFVVRGHVRRAALGPSGPEFVFPEPGGPVLRLIRAALLSDPELPARALARVEAGEEVVGLEGDAVGVRVRAYGPVVLEGMMPRAALGARERKEVGLSASGPTTYEVTVDADLLEAPSGRVSARVRGGTLAVLEEEAGGLGRIVTSGDVRTRGWLPLSRLTRLAPVEELLR